MRYAIRFSTRRVFLALLAAVTFLFVAGLVVTYLIWEKNYESALGFIPMFNLDTEFNIPTLFSVCLFTVNALLLFMAGKHTKTDRREKKYWRYLGYIFIYLAFDELTGTHERLGGVVFRLAPDIFSASESRYWMLPIGILLVLFAVYFFRFYRNLPKQTRLHFTLAGVVFITGAMGIEYLGDLYMNANLEADVYYGYLSCFEEAFEMTGMVIFLRAVLVHLQTLSGNRYFTLAFSTEEKEKANPVTAIHKMEQPAAKL